MQLREIFYTRWISPKNCPGGIGFNIPIKTMSLGWKMYVAGLTDERTRVAEEGSRDKGGAV